MASPGSGKRGRLPVATVTQVPEQHQAGGTGAGEPCDAQTGPSGRLTTLEGVHQIADVGERDVAEAVGSSRSLVRPQLSPASAEVLATTDRGETPIPPSAPDSSSLSTPSRALLPDWLLLRSKLATSMVYGFFFRASKVVWRGSSRHPVVLFGTARR